MYANYVTLVGVLFVKIEEPLIAELWIMYLLKLLKEMDMMIVLIYGALEF